MSRHPSGQVALQRLKRAASRRSVGLDGQGDGQARPARHPDPGVALEGHLRSARPVGLADPVIGASLCDAIASLLRLGEGSGAVSVLPIVRGAAAILSEMATFDSAGVSGRE